MNERKTEKIIKDKLTSLGYFEAKDIIIEEQKSDSEIINNLLSKASKSDSGAGYPEFIIRKKNSEWRDDGFVNYKNQRADRNNKWEAIKKQWLSDYRNRKEVDGCSVLKNVGPLDEWSALAYVKTNYKNITIRDFKNTIKDHLICNIKKKQA